MVDTSELEKFLNDKSAKESDIVEITGAGEIETKKDSREKTYKVLNLPVRCNGRELIYSPNSDAMKVLKKAFGTKTEDWIGKKFQIKIYPKTAFGQTNNAILPVIMDVKK